MFGEVERKRMYIQASELSGLSHLTKIVRNSININIRKILFAT